jgi:obg-like ATPase 1
VDTIKDHFSIITTKPIVYLVNLSKKDFCKKRNKWLPKIAEWVKSHGGGTVIPMSVEFEEQFNTIKEAEGAPKASPRRTPGRKPAASSFATAKARRWPPRCPAW